ncbi:MAG: hypothetical protein HFH45_06105 [Bacilli bacterium]|nr:hypothetical protein [Bacilli bacterium]
MMNFEKRNSLLPDYNVLEHETLEVFDMFEQIKKCSKEKFDLKDLSDSDIEEVLFELYINRLEPLRMDIDKIILIDYITNFFRRVYPFVYGVVVMADDSSSLANDQRLFEFRRKASNNNKQITSESFNKYFCFLNDGKIENSLNQDSVLISDELLTRVHDKKKDLFRAEPKHDPQFQAAHLPIEFNFDETYWREYADVLLNKKDELLSYFEENDKKEALKDFCDIADVYYLYASYYKMTSSLEHDKKRTK